MTTESTEIKSSLLDITLINEHETSQAVKYLYSGESGLSCTVGKQKYQMFIQPVSASYRSNTLEKVLSNKTTRKEMSFLSDLDINLKVFSSLWNFMNGACAYYAHMWMTPEELLVLYSYVKYFDIKELEGKMYFDMFIYVLYEKTKDAQYKQFVLDNKEQLLSLVQTGSSQDYFTEQIKKLTL